MRIGYSFWGFLGDYKEDDAGRTLSTPDGNASYSWSIAWEAMRRGHRVFMMQEDRDWPAFRRHGKYDFASFSQDKRFGTYLRMERANPNPIVPMAGAQVFPDLDVLLIEWRFPIPGRNTEADREKPGYQRDLERQTAMLRYYTSCQKEKRPRIVLFDLDHKITMDDERMLAEVGVRAIFETSVRPIEGLIPRTRVEIPFPVQDLLQHPLQDVDPDRKLVYVGSRYERDDVIDEWLKPVSEVFPEQVYFYGNWTAEYNFAEVRAKWPKVKYCDRITMKDFGKAYGTAVACPLIGKKSYLDRGFVTARLWEALLFGTLPVGLSVHHGIDQYLPDELIARDPTDLIAKIDGLARMGAPERDALRRRVVEKIDFMDVRHFLDHLEAAAGKG